MTVSNEPESGRTIVSNDGPIFEWNYVRHHLATPEKLAAFDGKILAHFYF